MPQVKDEAYQKRSSFQESCRMIHVFIAASSFSNLANVQIRTVYSKNISYCVFKFGRIKIMRFFIKVVEFFYVFSRIFVVGIEITFIINVMINLNTIIIRNNFIYLVTASLVTLPRLIHCDAVFYVNLLDW